MIWERKRRPAVTLASRVIKPPDMERSRIPSMGLAKASKERRGAMVVVGSQAKQWNEE